MAKPLNPRDKKRLDKLIEKIERETGKTLDTHKEDKEGFGGIRPRYTERGNNNRQ